MPFEQCPKPLVGDEFGDHTTQAESKSLPSARQQALFGCEVFVFEPFYQWLGAMSQAKTSPNY